MIASSIRNERYGDIFDSVHDVAFYLGAFPMKGADDVLQTYFRP